MCWQELLGGEPEPQGLFSHLREGDLPDFQGWDAVCATLLMAGLEPWQGAEGTGRDHLRGGWLSLCPLSCSPAERGELFPALPTSS